MAISKSDPESKTRTWLKVLDLRDALAHRGPALVGITTDPLPV